MKENILKILSEIKKDLIPILLLCVAWIPLFTLKRLYEKALPKILVRLPNLFDVNYWRTEKNVSLVLEKIKRDEITGYADVKEKLKLLENRISDWDKVIYSWNNTNSLRFAPYLLNHIVREIFDNNIAKLEIGMSFLQCYSENMTEKFSGYTSVVEYSNISDQDVIKFLIKHAGQIDNTILIAVLYQLPNRIKNENQVTDIRNLVQSKTFSKVEEEAVTDAMSKLKKAVNYEMA